MGNLSYITKLMRDVVEQIKELPDDAKIDAINECRRLLHEESPMKSEPVDCVLWVPSDTVQANDYNPNVVAPPEMKLLRLSVESDGFTMPIVTYEDNGHREVVDGFHRKRIGSEIKSIKNRCRGYLPVTTIRGDRTHREDRIAATIRHNRARGRHLVDNMSEIVVELSRRNWSNEKIGRELGMDPDEVLRLKQISGLAELFADREFSEAWEIE